MRDRDCSQDIAAAIQAAVAAGTPLAIHGNGSKQFLTGAINGVALDATGHRGIDQYEPTELVMTARAGTPLVEIEAALASNNQMLAFEPPHYGPGATLGGTIACNLSGPRRPYSGAARDFVLGTRIVNGRGEILSFGGQVMKNVAGYDISRLMSGSFGTLGVLLDISLKVLPKPAAEITLRFDMHADAAILKMNTWAGQPLPLSAACHLGESLHVRLSGTDQGVRAAHRRLGGELDTRGSAFWHDLREQQLMFFQNRSPLWRVSVPPAWPMRELPGKWLLDWGGAQRWWRSDLPEIAVHEAVRDAGGHVQRWRHPEEPEPIPRSSAVLTRLARNLRRAFDPHGIFNPTLNLV